MHLICFSTRYIFAAFHPSAWYLSTFGLIFSKPVPAENLSSRHAWRNNFIISYRLFIIRRYLHHQKDLRHTIHCTELFSRTERKLGSPLDNAFKSSSFMTLVPSFHGCRADMAGENVPDAFLRALTPHTYLTFLRAVWSNSEGGSTEENADGMAIWEQQQH